MRKLIELFRENLWIIEALTIDALCVVKRAMPHWKELFERCNITNLQVDEDLTL